MNVPHGANVMNVVFMVVAAVIAAVVDETRLFEVVGAETAALAV